MLFLCLDSPKNLPSFKLKIYNLDKIVHAVMHFTFTILWFLVFITNNEIHKKSILKALHW